MVRRTAARRVVPGTVSIESCGEQVIARPEGTFKVCRDVYEYVLAGAHTDLNSADRRLRLDVYHGSDGCRRFASTKADGPQGYRRRAFQIGERLLSMTEPEVPAVREINRLSKLAWDWLQQSHELLGRRVLSAESLLVPGYLRQELLRADSLPECFGDRLGLEHGEELVRHVVQLGLQTRRDEGYQRSNANEVLAWGVRVLAAEEQTTAARMREVRGLIQMALLKSDVTNTKRNEYERTVQGFAEVIGERLAWPQDQFNRWLCGRRAYMPQSVEKSIANNGVLNRETIRANLIRLAYHGLFYVGRCLDAFAQSFEASLDNPLTAKERKMFRAIFRTQPHFGGLAMIQLVETVDLLKPVLRDLITPESSTRAIAVLHQMLRYRAEVVTQVREVDRLRKSRLGGTYRLNGSDAPVMKQPGNNWNELIEHIFETRGIRCSHTNCSAVLASHLIVKKTEHVVVAVECPEHGSEPDQRISMEELRDARANLMET